MSIYHCSIKIISRGKGKTALAASAYRAGCVLRDEVTGKVHDYSRKKGVVHTEILLPGHAPIEFNDRSTLWNSVHKIEKQKNSQLAREIELSMPRELNREQQIALARRYVGETFVNAGMCADVCLHDKDDGNPHIHVMLTMRPLNPDGSWGQKAHKENGKKVQNTDWNDRDKAEEWRKAWAAYANGAMQLAGVLTEDNALDHRSYSRQGKDEFPTIHMGVAASQMEQKGIRTDKGNYNREIKTLNSKLRQIKARIRKLEDWKLEVTATPPTLHDVFSEILNGSNNRTQRQTIDAVKLAYQALIFIDKYGIDTLDDMTAAVKKLHVKYSELKSESTATSRRYVTLSEHIKQSEIYNTNKSVYHKWSALKEGSDKENSYYTKNKDEITAFVAAHKYLDRHLNGRKRIPLADWKREFAEVSSRHTDILAASDKLLREIKSAEAIKRNAERVMGVEASRRREVEVGE